MSTVAHGRYQAVSIGSWTGSRPEYHNRVKTTGTFALTPAVLCQPSEEIAMPKSKKPEPKSGKTPAPKTDDAEPSEKDREPWDKVEEAEEESFPASDPPAY
jgi:hypothetical protein